MKKYLQIIRGTIAEYMEYRLSFVLWRIRIILQLLVAYFLWSTVTADHPVIFGYRQGDILTYILLTLLVRPFVMGTRTQEIGNMIRTGSLNTYLLRPIHFLRFAFSRDVADKLMNVVMALGEFILLFFLLRPTISLNIQAGNMFLIAGALTIGLIAFFFFSIIFSYLAFWTDDVWAPRFLSFVFAEFFTGLMFPLDILPQPLHLISQLLPFTYFIYFPVRVALGGLTTQALLVGFAIGIAWTVGLWFVASKLWRRGLRVYGAVGI